MKLTQSEENGRILVTISGKCTVEHAAALREALLAATSPGKPVTLDLAEVEGRRYHVAATAAGHGPDLGKTWHGSVTPGSTFPGGGGGCPDFRL